MSTTNRNQSKQHAANSSSKLIISYNHATKTMDTPSNNNNTGGVGHNVKLNFTKTIGSNNNPLQHQPLLSPASSSSSTSSPSNRFQQHLQIVNAPTSLANLAQFSGISLMPIGTTNESQPTSRSTKASNSHNKQQSASLSAINNKYMSPQIYCEPNPAAGSSKNNRNDAGTTSIGWAQFINNQPKPSAKSSRPPQSIFNLAATMPSIQMLNTHQATTSIPSFSSDTPRRSISNGLLKNQPNQTATNMAQVKARVNSTKKINLQQRQQQKNQTTGDLSHLATGVTENLPFFSDTNRMQSSSPQPMGSKKFDGNESTSQPKESLDFSSILEVGNSGDGINNLSLLGLMAILNNPVLTITPVSSSPTTSKPQDSRSGANLQQNTFGSFDYANGIDKTSKPNSSDANVKARMPQSTANLQKVCAGRNGQINGGDKQTKANDKGSSFSNMQALHRPWDNLITGDSSNHSATLTWVNALNPNLDSRDVDSFPSETTHDSVLTSARSLTMQKSASDQPHTVSVELLKHIAWQQSSDPNWDSQSVKEILEPNIIMRPPQKISDLGEGVKIEKQSASVTRASIPKKPVKRPLRTTRERLYIPREPNAKRKSAVILKDPGMYLDEILINSEKTEQVYLSEQHFILESMMPESSKQRPDHKLPEPDDIFVNRSKRIMSKIDTMLERKKRRRFERISSRSSPKTTSLEDQLAESDAEWSEDENTKLDPMRVIKTQLPLEEPETEAKRKHLLAVELVSRSERNKILAKQIETRSNIFSPLALLEPSIDSQFEEDIKQFSSAILKTGGIDVQLRVDTNIKRNDLPLIEGLNRNTSRIKMSYMSALGLDKRSKRTTLYKVKSSEGQNIVQHQQQQQQPQQLQASSPKDLNGKLTKATYTIDCKKGNILNQATSNKIVNDKSSLNPAPRTNNLMALTSCREAIKSAPNKDEYMKSLGLMAS